ncbi:MAG: hypothetical protein U0798_19230 [Gemmataceae bacterium]
MLDENDISDGQEKPLSLGKRIAWYGSIAIISLVTAMAGLQLFIVDTKAPYIHANCDFAVPFYYHVDALLILPFVKETIESGTHWHTDRLGAPGIQELYDFPVIDHFHFAILWLLGKIVRDPVVAFNVYHLATYPAVALAMMAVLRHFGRSMSASSAGGMIYTFLPYHALRGESHYFLSAYYFVPITTMLILWICRGTIPFFRKEGANWKWDWHNHQSIGAIVISVITSMAGAYYAFFACALLVPAGIIGAIRTKSWRPLVSCGICIGILCMMGVVQHIPTFWYHQINGPNTNPTERTPEEAELYGLKAGQLVLPVTNHNWRALAWIKGMFNSENRPNQNENETTTLGLVGTVGLIALCCMLFFGRRLSWPYGIMAILTGYILLLSFMGGFGSVFNLLVTPQVRCYNRIVVYLAVLVTMTVVTSIDRWFNARQPLLRKLKPLGFTLLAIFAIWDQSGDKWFRSSHWQESDVVESREEYLEDREFFEAVEERFGECLAFTYPYVPYPESQWVYGLESYSHVRGYLHTKRMRWSFGAIKGREADTWARQVSLEPPEAMLRRLAYRGFDCLFVDQRGLPPERAEAIVQSFRQVLGSVKDASSAPIVHSDGKQHAFDLSTYRDWLISQLGVEGYKRAAKAEAEQLSVLWLKGFPIAEIPGQEDRLHRCGPWPP